MNVSGKENLTDSSMTAVSIDGKLNVDDVCEPKEMQNSARRGQI